MLQTDLDRLSVWEDRWDMEFNPSKCQVVRLTSSRTLFNIAYIYSAWSSPGGCHKYKVLWVDISSGLSWNPHIDCITGNANRTLNFIQRNIKTKNQKVRETVYNTLVPPSWSMLPPFGTHTLRREYSSWEKYSARQHAEPQAVLTTSRASLPS